MKRIFILLQVMAIHLAIFSQSNYNLKFEENEFSFSETAIGYQILSKSVDYYLLGDTTLPALPHKTIHILIPENTEVENVNVSIKSREIGQNIYLISNPVDKPVSAVSNNNSTTSNYSEKMYPDKNLKFETIIKSQGFYMAAFSVCPFIYDAQKRSLELITEMDISFSQSIKTTTESTNSSVRRYDMQDFIRSLVINPEEINTLYSQQITSLLTRGTTNVIDSIKVMPRNISISDNVLFTTFSKPFGGDCTYQLNLDSIIDTKIYISGKFESDAKCMGKGANDTIDIGLLPARTYELAYKFIDIKSEDDIVPNVPTETYNIEFVVFPSSKVQDVKIKEFDLYPNPCDYRINILFPNTDNQIKHIQLFDISGEVIYEKNINQNLLQINMSSYNQGIYFIRIVSNNNEYKRKIIKR